MTESQNTDNLVPQSPIKSDFMKPISAMLIALGGFIPFTVLAVFSTQLFKQMDFNNLGFYILGVVAFSSAIACLLSPGIVLRLGSKKALIFSSGCVTYFSLKFYPIEKILDSSIYFASSLQ